MITASVELVAGMLLLGLMALAIAARPEVPRRQKGS
jgi:hypothetical protein